MPIDNHVTSFEWSKRLKEFGVKQDSFIYWVKCSGTHPSGNAYNCGWQIQDISFVEDELENIKREEPEFETFEYVSAFLSSELGEMLPYLLDGGKYQLISCKGEKCWGIWYRNTMNNLIGEHYQNADTESNARAAMMCYLIEKGLVKPC